MKSIKALRSLRSRKAPPKQSKPSPAKSVAPEDRVMVRPPPWESPPVGRCSCCTKPAKVWISLWERGEWSYRFNGVQLPMPAPHAFCTMACAKEVAGKGQSPKLFEGIGDAK